MKKTVLASALALLSVSPLACSDDASIGDDQQATEASHDDDAASAADDAPADDAPGDDTSSGEDDVSGNDDATNADVSDDDVSGPVTPNEPAADDDVTTEPEVPTDTRPEPVTPEPTTDPAEPSAEPGVTPSPEPSPADPGAEPEVAPTEDAGTPPVSCDPAAECSDACPEDCVTPNLVTETLYGNRYDAEAGCFELRLTPAGTIQYDPENPVACTAAFSLGQSPSGECYSFNSGCQPEGFVRVRPTPTSPGGVEHECAGAESCPSEWECEFGVVPQELDRSCEVDDDCYSQFYAGPCGCTSSVIGFNKLDAAALAAHRSACVDPSVCECATPPSITDSGEAVQSLSQSLVECVAGQCVTRRDPAYCAEANQCVTARGECVETSSSNCRNADGNCGPCP